MSRTVDAARPRDWGDPEVVNPAVEFLAELAGDGAALELGIGTGRIVLPLAAQGVLVYGIDLPEAMVARLRAKPGGAEIPVAIGDFSTTRVDGRFSLAYVVFNTIMNLRTQEAQVACFENVAAHLEAGGSALSPDPRYTRLSGGATTTWFGAMSGSAQRTGIELTRKSHGDSALAGAPCESWASYVFMRLCRIRAQNPARHEVRPGQAGAEKAEPVCRRRRGTRHALTGK